MSTTVDDLVSTWGWRHKRYSAGPWSARPPPHYRDQVVADEMAVNEQILRTGRIDALPDTVHTEAWLWQENDGLYIRRATAQSREEMAATERKAQQLYEGLREAEAFERRRQMAQGWQAPPRTGDGDVLYVPSEPGSERPAKQDTGWRERQAIEALRKEAELQEYRERIEQHEQEAIARRRQLAIDAEHKAQRHAKIRRMRTEPPLRPADPADYEKWTHISIAHRDEQITGRLHFCAKGDARAVKDRAIADSNLWADSYVRVHDDGSSNMAQGQNNGRFWYAESA